MKVIDIRARLLTAHCRNILTATENTSLMMTDCDLSNEDRASLETARRRIESALQKEPQYATA